ncbi:MAG TPA: TIGR03435 family protein [Acidobacteriaceae bacterium]|nr:TIGR03435 family protein [Acidobacteriaceae bacterium]
MRVRLLSSAAALLGIAGAVGMSQTVAPSGGGAVDAHLSFAAATIKPHNPDDPCRGCSGFDAEGDRMKIRNKSASSIMQVAYAINPRQIVGAPDWFYNESFDIMGTMDTPGEPTRAQYQAMLQNLLADRFGLRFHHDTRDLAVYAVEIAKGGPKIKTAGPEEKTSGDDMRNGQDQKISLTSASVKDFAERMQFFVDRPVVDQTGLAGKYDFSLHYTVDETRTADPNAPPGLFTAIQEQLGLKLVPVKAPADVFVVDGVEQPSAD